MLIHVNKTATMASLLLTAGLVLAGCSGAPVAKGVAGGNVGGCPGSDNCVSSFTSRSGQKIEPLKFTGSKADAMTKLKAVLAQREDAKIVNEKADYLHVEFTTKLMGFVDDAEFLLATDNIQMRSASRVGYSDFGKNRARLQEIRSAFEPCCN